jgi:hypothetical protein
MSALRPIGRDPDSLAEDHVPSLTSRKTEVSEDALKARLRWRTATWFGVVTFLAWSPVTTINRVLPAGSTIRGIALTVIPLVGVVAVMKLPKRRTRKLIDLSVLLLFALVVWQGISVETTAGLHYLLHVVPAVALLILAVAARDESSGMSVDDIRFAIAGILPALCAFLLVGWIAQYAHLVPLTGPAGSTLGLSVDGYRLQGLTSGPNLLGFLAALITLIAFVAQAGKVAWFTRVVGILTLLASDSRTSILVLGIGLFALWVLRPGLSMSKRVIPLAALTFGGLGVWPILVSRRSANTDVLSNRDEIWRDLFPYLHHLPLFGYGPNFLPKLVPLVFGPYALADQILDPQNQWLNDSIQYGFMAAILLTLLLLAIPLHGSKTYRRTLLLPLLLMVFVECFSEVPLAVFGSIDGAFPLFFLVMWAPLRRNRELPKYESPSFISVTNVFGKNRDPSKQTLSGASSTQRLDDS